MDLTHLFQQLGIALGLGLLVGLQRERVASRLAGVRTFPLVTIMGTLCALLAQTGGNWILAAGFISLAALIFANKTVEAREGHYDTGLTTEVAILLMFAVGAYLAAGERVVAIAIGGGVAVLLQFKGELHGMVAKLGDNDLKAIMQFVLLSFVILPVLPNRTYGPYSVLNPRLIWWMVVLIVAISLFGYVIYKFYGSKAGVIVGGVLGGMISSTATTASYGRRTVVDPGISRMAAVVIMIATSVLYIRLIVVIGVISPAFAWIAAPPFLIMLLVLGLLSLGMWHLDRGDTHEMPVQGNPTELKPAIYFGLLYACILFGVAAAKEIFGNKALYLIAAISGLTDVDAITISTTQLVQASRLDPGEGWRMILLATLTNLVFKAGLAAVVGCRKLILWLAPLFGIVLVAGCVLLFLWPH